MTTLSGQRSDCHGCCRRCRTFREIATTRNAQILLLDRFLRTFASLLTAFCQRAMRSNFAIMSLRLISTPSLNVSSRYTVLTATLQVKNDTYVMRSCLTPPSCQMIGNNTRITYWLTSSGLEIAHSDTRILGAHKCGKAINQLMGAAAISDHCSNWPDSFGQKKCSRGYRILAST